MLQLMSNIEEKFDSLCEQEDVLRQTCRTVATYCCQCVNVDGHQFEHLTYFCFFSLYQPSYVNKFQFCLPTFFFFFFFQLCKSNKYLLLHPVYYTYFWRQILYRFLEFKLTTPLLSISLHLFLQVVQHPRSFTQGHDATEPYFFYLVRSYLGSARGFTSFPF